MAQPRIGFLVVSFGGLNQAGKLSACCRAFRCVAEQPDFSADDKRSDRTLGSVVVDGQVAFLNVPLEFFPVVCQVGDRFAESVLCSHVGQSFQHPSLQLT